MCSAGSVQVRGKRLLSGDGVTPAAASLPARHCSTVGGVDSLMSASMSSSCSLFTAHMTSVAPFAPAVMMRPALWGAWSSTAGAHRSCDEQTMPSDSGRLVHYHLFNGEFSGTC